jgi:toxin ParE1/3/4
MPVVYQFEPDARIEYHAAIRYYATEADDPEAAFRFVAAVEAAVAAICAAPEIWRVVEPPDVRRYVLRRFPYIFYCCYRSTEKSVVIYALMHTSRRPGYWRERLP